MYIGGRTLQLPSSSTQPANTQHLAVFFELNYILLLLYAL